MTLLAHEKEIREVEETLNRLKEQNKSNSLWSPEELLRMEKKLEQLKVSIYSQLTPWERVAICRHPQRPQTSDYIDHITDEFVELFGDRTFRDDPAIIAGLATIKGRKAVLIGQEKGRDTESRLRHNFGMPHPEGYRKALRCMQLAAKFRIPVITLLDTPGAYPGLSAEERGQGTSIARNLFEMARLPTPILVILIGEGCSGGALGMGLGDSIGMLEHSYYSVISPEGCASILWKDPSKNAAAAAALKMHPEDLFSLGIIDQIIPEPLGGAHHHPAEVYKKVTEFIENELDRLFHVSSMTLLENRYQKFRRMGKVDEAYATAP